MILIRNPHSIFAKIRIHQIYWIRSSAEIIIEIHNPKEILAKFADPQPLSPSCIVDRFTELANVTFVLDLN